MSDTDYRKALDAACREWETLAAERTEIDKRLADLQRTIVTLTRLCGYTPTVPLGLADACRLILMRHHDEAMSAQAMREHLDAMGLDLSAHSSPLASIHVTLKRLVAAGQARFVPGAKGRPPLYGWSGEPRVVAARSRAHAMTMMAPWFSAAPPAPAGRAKKGKKR